MTINELSILYKNEPTEKHFTDLILAYRNTLQGNVLSILKERKISQSYKDDISSEMEYFLYKNMEKYFDPDVGDFETWAFRVTKQFVNRYIRDNFNNFIIDTNIDIERLGIIDDMKELSFVFSRIDSMINKLPNDISVLIKEHFYNGVTYTDLSETYGIPYAEIRRKCVGGLLKIKEELYEIERQN